MAEIHRRKPLIKPRQTQWHAHPQKIKKEPIKKKVVEIAKTTATGLGVMAQGAAKGIKWLSERNWDAAYEMNAPSTARKKKKKSKKKKSKQGKR